jgi:hypothetical protein
VRSQNKPWTKGDKTAVITCEQVTEHYPDGTVAADGLSLNAPDGKLTGLVVT